MSYLTLLFPSQTQGMVNVAEASREAEHAVFADAGACEGMWTRSEEGAEDHLLPSGIVSMEHWLDLNA